MIDTGNIAVVLLAAGRSERFGPQDKLLADLEGEPLIAHTARTIADLGPAARIGVCSDAQGTAARLLRDQGFTIVENPNPERGLSQSLALGISEAAEGPAQAALVCLGDMPFVSLVQLYGLMARFDPDERPIVASALNEIAMPPALFARSLFDRLREAQGDSGGRGLLAGATLVPATAAELTDIDLPEDLPRRS